MFLKKYKRIITIMLSFAFATSTASGYDKSFSTRENTGNVINFSTRNNEAWLEPLSSMPTARSGFGSIEYNGKIYCIGGVTSEGTTGALEVYDIASNKWDTSRKPMPTPRRDFAIGFDSDENEIYCFGGERSGYGVVTTVEKYNIASDTWTTMKAMPQARKYFSVIYRNYSFYYIGGFVNDSTPVTDKIYIFDTIDGIHYDSGIKLPALNYSFSSNLVGNKLYIIGGKGISSDNYNSILSYDFSSKKWTEEGSLNTGRDTHTSTIYNNKLYIMGGVNKDYQYIENIEIFDLNSKEVSLGGLVSPAKKGLESITYNNSIYAIGGELADNTYSFDVLHYNTDYEYTPPVEPEFPEETPLLVSKNIDIYIKIENTLSLSLNTNSLSFDDFNVLDDITKNNAINITVGSSLPYSIKASLESEIQGNNSDNKLDKSILKVKSSDDSEYKTFERIGTPVTLLENIDSTDSTEHSIDFLLTAGSADKKDVYKTTMKFIVEQN